MGLDIIVYTAVDDSIHANDADGYYAKVDAMDKYHIRNFGSYGEKLLFAVRQFGEFLQELAVLVNVAKEELWDIDYDSPARQPFHELLQFADNNCMFNSAACARLLADIDKFDVTARAAGDRFYENYATLRRCFSFGARGGMVEFAY